jgi:tRNA dimethylallyltransferase
MPQYDLITLLGPTASGKTRLASRLAYTLDSEIISADSRQLYRRMNIGSGKDLSEYIVDDRQVPYHLIDIVEPGYKYNVFEYQRDFLRAYDAVCQQGKLPIVCGGTGLYIESVLRGYRLSRPTDAPPFPELCSLTVGVGIDRETRRERISQRLRSRLEEGLVEEVRSLLAEGVSEYALLHYGLEYKYVTLYLTDRMTYEEMCAQLEIAIHQFAKRQMTWFRGMERRGCPIVWLDSRLPVEENVARIIGLLTETEHR